jgi:Lon protease-like protein
MAHLWSYSDLSGPSGELTLVAETLPMFPLGIVLVPEGIIPLHVFEPRYRTMLDDVMTGEGHFGVVLIERGSEVGGGDLRMDVGTMARVINANQLADDHWLVVVMGTGRIRVKRWLPDDPYPLAEVSKFPDEPGSSVDRRQWVALKGQMRRALAGLTELGDTVACSSFELGDDPAAGSFQLAGFGPFSDFDRQRVLATPGVSGRCVLLTELLDEVEVLIKLRLGTGEEADRRRR